MRRLQLSSVKTSRRKGQNKGVNKESTMEIKEDDIVLCTVKRVEGTTVFVEIEGNGEGSIVMSEIAAGRIRNLRDYVTINKKIVCKVLRVSDNDIRLTLRRVTAKERDEAKERYQKEQTIRKLIKVIKAPDKIVDEIKKELSLSDFFDKARVSLEIIEKFFSKSQTEQLTKLIAEKREKDKEAKQTILLKSQSDSGIKEIKEVLSIQEAKNLDIRYLGSSKFSISTKAKDFKEANHRIQLAIEAMKLKAKERKLLFEA